MLGIYTNLMTRRSVLGIIAAAKVHEWRVILGGPESANYTDEYLAAGADVIVIGEGELALGEYRRAPFAHGAGAIARGAIVQRAGTAVARSYDRCCVRS